MRQTVRLHDPGQMQGVQDLILAFERGKAFWHGILKDFENDRLLVQHAPRTIHGGGGTGVQLGVEMIRREGGHENVLC